MSGCSCSVGWKRCSVVWINIVVHPSTVHACLVEVNRCWFEQEVNAASNGKSCSRIPRVAGHCFILSGRTERTDVVVCVCVTRIISCNNPNTCRTCSICDVTSNFKQFRGRTVNHCSSDCVSRLEDLSWSSTNQSHSVGANCCQSTIPDFRRRGSNIDVTISGSTGGICTVVTVLCNCDKTDIRVGICLCEVNTTGSCC